MEDNGILIFTTTENIRHLSRAKYWIMDGTFKTAPIIFKQLYTIHAPVGGTNQKIVPLLYALMTAKSEELYKRLFQELNEMANREDIELKPDFVITDFEMAAINAVKFEFPGVQNKGCFFHLGQSVYRKIQNLQLASRYGTDEDFSIKIRQIPALAFLSPLEIPEAFDNLKPQLPEEAADLIKWFEDNYVHGRVRKRLRNGNTTRWPPLFPPDLWSVFENEELGFPRTQNKVEAWHRRWQTLVGRAHVGVFSLIVEIQKEQDTTEGEIERINRGQAPQKRRKEDANKEMRLQTIIQNKANRSIQDFIRAIAHSIYF